MLLIVGVLVTIGFIQKEIKAYSTSIKAMEALKRGNERIESDAAARVLAVHARLEGMSKKASTAVAQRIAVLDQELSAKKSVLDTSPDPKACILFGGDACTNYVDAIKAIGDVRILAYERDSLTALKYAMDSKNGVIQLERLRRLHALVYAQLQDNQAQLSQLRNSTPFWEKHSPWSSVGQQIRFLEREHAVLYARNKAAHDAYVVQKSLLAAIAQSHTAIRLSPNPLDAVTAPLHKAIAEAEANYVASPVAWIFRSVDEVFPTAVMILMGILIAPLGTKAFLYFVIAPLAARCAPVTLLPAAVWQGSAAFHSTANDPGRCKISAVSQSITIDPHQELLIDPEYLLSSESGVSTETKWLLDWSHPMSSIAAGLFGLTRIRAQITNAILVSAAKDPLAEIGVISLASGSALVLQPHRLVGVVQEIEHPVRITTHWRLGSLSAWLTLQLRYLVFHGPVKLIVTGCRGVCVATARSGHAINQAATIGFSANLAYSTKRAEAFGAYLMGKQELFNDSFDSGPGIFVYEEMPHAGKKTGLFGRGIDGLSDSLLKVIGI